MPSWKQNWPESRERLEKWWKRSGVVIGAWDPPVLAGKPHEVVPEPDQPPNGDPLQVHPQLRAEWNHYLLSRSDFPDDVLPVADTDIGPGSLCLFLGCEPRFGPDTVWFEPCWDEVDEVGNLPTLHFDPDGKWWRITESTLKACVEKSGGRYFTGCPDLVENIDILAALRDPKTLMVDLLEEPEWVEQKVREITDVWIEAYNRIYEIIREPDGSSFFGAFRAWGPGKTAKLQCDASAMFSPEMYHRFVLPELSRQCAWLDHSLYHLDGTQAVCHLDALLEVETLDAIEWTPQAGIETGGSPHWYSLYKRILEAGKSLQVVGVKPGEVEPLLNAVGHNGIYIHVES